jgi:putative SOS response-associated peptidase YedK
MCGRAGQDEQTITDFKKERQIVINFDIDPWDNWDEIKDSDNISHSERTIVIVEKGEKVLKGAKFGFLPSWSGGYIPLNARCEGKLNKVQLNITDDPDYDDQFLIDEMPMFKKAIKEHRCIFPVKHFIEGSKDKKLSEPYIIRRKDKKPFALGGIVSYAQNDVSFAIITTAASRLLREEVGHHRSPLVLSKNEEYIWLDHSLPMSQIKKLFHPFDDSDFEAIPIENNIKSGKDKEIKYKQPPPKELF